MKKQKKQKKHLVVEGTVYRSDYALISDSEGSTEGAEPLTEVFKRQGLLVGNDPTIDAQRLADATGGDVVIVKLRKGNHLVECKKIVHPS